MVVEVLRMLLLRKSWENNEGMAMTKVFLTDAAVEFRDSRYLGLESLLFAYVFM